MPLKLKLWKLWKLIRCELSGCGVNNVLVAQVVEQNLTFAALTVEVRAAKVIAKLDSADQGKVHPDDTVLQVASLFDMNSLTPTAIQILTKVCARILSLCKLSILLVNVGLHSSSVGTSIIADYCSTITSTHCSE